MIRGDRLKEARLARGFTQLELAELCGMGSRQIHRYESGETDVSGQYLVILSEKLGVSADYLLGLTDEPKGIAAPDNLKRDERELLDVYRRDGWPGVFHLGADRIK